jgi:cullin-associated NEDD8-dissociated protein 1
VQSVAVKCLAIILKKVQPAQIGEICRKLCALILDGKDALRDIYSIGLKTLIADVPDATGQLVSQQLTSKLLSGIARSGPEEIVRECLDNMTDLLRRFGHLSTANHADIMHIAVQKLESDKPIIRKRAANCLGALAVVSSDGLLNTLVNILLEKIEILERSSSSHSLETRTLIQTIGTVSRTVGFRLGKHLEKIVPLFLKFCGSPEDENQHSDAYNELRETCFPGLESFVSRCPREVTPFLLVILDVSLQFMKYDPNYSYDDDEDENEKMQIDENFDDQDNQEYEDEEDFGGSDDDDTSWKVRKVAVRVVNAVIQARPELLNDLYVLCAKPLISRFKEREENVRIDIISCFNSLVTATINAKCIKPNATKSVELLENNLVSLITTSCNQLSSTSVKTKSVVFALLKNVVVALHVSITTYKKKFFFFVFIRII